MTPEIQADQEAECYAEEAYLALSRLSFTEGDHVIARYLMTRAMKGERDDRSSDRWDLPFQTERDTD